MYQATVTARALDGLQHGYGMQGIDVVAVARRYGLDEGVWDDLDVEIPLRGFTALMDALAAASDDPASMWRLGRAFDVRRLGDVGRALLASRTLGDALVQFRDHLSLLQSDARMSLHVADDVTTLRYRILDPTIWPRRADAEFTLGLLQHLVDRFAGDARYPTRLTLERHAGDVAALSEAIGVPCRSGADSNELRIPTRLLSCPANETGEASPDERERLRDDLRRRHAERRRDLPYTHRARCALFGRLGRRPLDQGSVAAELNVTRRTLRRRLAEESTTYHALLHECRMDVACHELAYGQLGCAEIALRVGYSEQSAFTRSFSRALGQTPREYRRSRTDARRTPCDRAPTVTGSAPRTATVRDARGGQSRASGR